MPPFTLTPEQIAKLDAEPSDIGRTVLLQVWHQNHCKLWDREIVGRWGSLDPAQFSLRWMAREDEFLREAWAAYHLCYEFQEAAE